MDKTEQILLALLTRLQGTPYEPADGSTVAVARNLSVPSLIPDGGLVILRDGDSGEPDWTLGGFDDHHYYRHAIPVEIHVQHADGAERDQRFSALVGWIFSVLKGDRTLGGLVTGMVFGLPESDLQLVEGGAAIKSGRVMIMVEYGCEI
ncbi:MAG: acyl-CoA transferase [Magnetococcales bacterium]|nr:acyl-CoA transferase [Magnetococcales bacterium]